MTTHNQIHHKQLDAILQTVTWEEEMVLRMRFGLLDRPIKYTRKEISEPFGVTYERIRQIEAKGLRKLRHPMRCKPLKNLIGVPEFSKLIEAVFGESILELTKHS